MRLDDASFLENTMKNSIISGAYDLHVHTGPDFTPRKLDDLEMAQRVNDSGMKGYAIKSHASDTTARAYMVRKRFPECDAISSVTLNSYHGGINPLAVEIAAQLGAKIVWFPTIDSTPSFERHAADTSHRTGYPPLLRHMKDLGISCSPVKILDNNGKVLPAVHDVLDVARQYGLILGTGHLSLIETRALVKAAYERKNCKIIVTHVSYRPESGAQGLDKIEQQQEFIRCGAYIEHCALPALIGRISFESVVDQIKGTTPDRVVLSSDLGQVKNVYPDEGLLEYCNKLVEHGISETDIRKMIVCNPAQLLKA